MIKVSNKMIESVKGCSFLLPIFTQKLLKQKIVTVEIKAIKEKRLKLANKISVLYVDVDLLATKLEKLLIF